MKTQHSIHLHIPTRWLWRSWREFKIVDGVAIAQKREGWRAFLTLWRVRLEFRRERLGSLVPRHGTVVSLMTPWASVNWCWRAQSWESPDLLTKIHVLWGHVPWGEMKPGMMPYRKGWEKVFWRNSGMCFYRDHTGAARIL